MRVMRNQVAATVVLSVRQSAPSPQITTTVISYSDFGPVQFLTSHFDLGILARYRPECFD